MTTRAAEQLQGTIDQNTTLCLACSSSLPPRKPTSQGTDIFITRCCQRPICPACVSSNPRLARYDPCLACLGGVDVVGARMASKRDESVKPKNVDGAVRDEDAFVLGGDDEDSEDEVSDPIPPYILSPETPPSDSTNLPGIAGDHITEVKLEDTTAQQNVPVPSKYYIKGGDTLQAVALRFGINGRELCQLNQLPPSTLTTTPHILHTRTYLILPSSAQGKMEASQAQLDTEDKERETRRARERAGKRLQTLTREVDWRVAKAYVAIAEDPDEAENYAFKMKERSSAPPNTPGAGSSRLGMMAVNQYLDDDEWEARERREGRPTAISRFPYFNHQSKDKLKAEGHGMQVNTNESEA